MTKRSSRMFVAATGLLGLSLTGVPLPVSAAPGYTYDLIAEFPLPQETVNHASPCTGIAINNRGDIAYQTSERVPLQGGALDYLVQTFLARPGEPPRLIHQGLQWTGNVNPAAAPFPGFSGCDAFARPLGLNDDGIVAIPAHWIGDAGVVSSGNEDSIGYVLVDANGTLVRVIRDLVGSSGRLNAQLQMAGTPGPEFIRVSDGGTTRDYHVGPTVHSYQAIVNQHGVAASLLTGPSQNLELAIADPSDPLGVSLVVLGPFQGDWYTDALQIGFNNLNWASVATNTNLLQAAPPRVILIGPGGQLALVADTSTEVLDATDSGVRLTNFSQGRFGPHGTSLNNYNQVLFGASTLPGLGASSNAILVGNVSGDLPTPALWTSETISVGSRLFTGACISCDDPFNSLNTNSLNDKGDVAFLTLINEVPTPGHLGLQAIRLLVAHPGPGMDPGNPILPGDGGTLDGGGVVLRPPPNTIRLVAVPCTNRFCYFDPPVAAGYIYEMNPGSQTTFTSAYIPVPLANGDGEFSVEYGGFNELLISGKPVDFTVRVPGGVSTFRITGIDLGEALDPNDPRAFVTGLKFQGPGTDNFSFTMTPIVENTDDPDGDGVIASRDNCPAVANPGQEDADGDGVGDACDLCPGTAAGSAVNAQGCSAAQQDADGDGVPNVADACPGTAPGAAVDARGCSADQRDTDGDGVVDGADLCPATAPGAVVDARGCSADQRDTDGDGVVDGADLCPATAPGAVVDANGCSAAQRDTDGDGVADSADLCPGTVPGTAVDANGCSAAQRDSDGDGVVDSVDACPGTAPGTPVDASGCPLMSQTRTCDADGDGDIDKYDIKAIVKAVGRKATGPNDPRDPNRNARIDLVDVLICGLKCDRLFCASP